MNLDNFDIDEFIGVIIDGFEDYLKRKGVVADMLPDEDRHEIDGEISTCIFGGKLYDDVADIIRKVVEDIDLDIINARDALARQAPRIMCVWSVSIMLFLKGYFLKLRTTNSISLMLRHFLCAPMTLSGMAKIKKPSVCIL